MRTIKPRINHIPITQARINLGAVVKRVHLNGEYFILEKDGIPVAGIMSVDEFEDHLELRNRRVIKQIAQSKKDYDAGKVSSAWNLLDELKDVRVTKGKRGTKKTAKTS